MTDTPDKHIATIAKNVREQIRIQLRTYKGYRSVDVRVFALNADGDWIATAKGVSIKPEALEEILRALKDAHAFANAEGLL